VLIEADNSIASNTPAKQHPGSNNLLDNWTQLTYGNYGLSFSALSADHLN
jgi:hypothetical protein